MFWIWIKKKPGNIHFVYIYFKDGHHVGSWQLLATMLLAAGSVHSINMEIIAMKPVSSIFAMSVLALFLSTPVTATEHHTAQAMEHAGMAQGHGEDGHAKVLLKHAQESLKHAQASEKEHAEQHKHMSEAVKHLKEAIQHAKADHADVATKHVEEALVHMRQSTTVEHKHH
jgi:hypothetical protein